jgi:DNA-binding LacI/PurR family transcriptional regulator
MSKSPTVYDVAARAGVSIATVSFTFRQPHRVRETTRETVMTAARDLGYVPSASARGLAHGRTGALGLYSFDYFGQSINEVVRGISSPSLHTGAVFSDEDNEDFRLFPLYHDEIQRGMEAECGRRGYVLMVGEGGAARSQSDIAEIAGRVDGLAVLPNTLPRDVLGRIAERIPVVELSVPFKDNGLHQVSVDNFGGMKALTEHMIDEHGLKDLVFVGPNGSTDKQARHEGYTQAMRAAGLTPNTIETDQPDPIQFVDGVVRNWMNEGELPQGVLCSVDEEALVYMDALKKAGISVPQQVAVTGFNGVAAGLVSRPSLTTVRQPLIRLGVMAASILVDQMTKRSSNPVVEELPVKVMIRESCGCES